MESSGGEDGFAVPFFTLNDAYFVPHPDKDGRGKPVVLRLRDLTGEGVAGQFVLFDYLASAVEATSVWGYSPKSDRAVNYPVEVNEGKFRPVVQPWVTQVFATAPTRPGYWKFTWEAGHGSTAWVDEEVRFDPVRELYVERKTIRPYPGYQQVFCRVRVASLAEFLHRIGTVAPDFDAEEIRGVRSLIDGTPSGAVEATGIVATFRGRQESLDLRWQRDGNGWIGIVLTSESDFTAALRGGLARWCGSN